MMNYAEYAVLVPPRGAFKDIENPRSLLTSLFKRLMRTARSYLPQIAIGLLVLVASICLTYYYYYIN